MKAYFFKTTRDTATGNIHVQDVMETSGAMKPYYMRRPSVGLVETMQVFTRKKDALEACQLEKEAAALSRRDFSEVQQEALSLLAAFKRDWHIPVLGVAKMLNIPAATLRTYYEGRAMSPRIILRVKKLYEFITDACKRAAAVLPDSGSTGCGNKGRGGNPDIWRSSPTKRKDRTA